MKSTHFSLVSLIHRWQSKHNFYLSVMKIEVNFRNDSNSSLFTSKSNIMKIQNAFLLLLAISLFSCKNDNSTSSADAETKTIKSTSNKYTLTPFTPSQDFSGAELQNMTYNDGIFNFTVGGEGYELGQQTPDKDSKMCANSGKGQHIHLILNNEPYAAKYTSTFEYDVADGEHYLLAFLSRSYHESIKTLKAAIHAKIQVKDKKLTQIDGISEAMVMYSRPKGTYVGKNETDKVMLDFYLLNADLANGYGLTANINGEIHTIDKWQPYYIEGLPMGENTIELTLLDGQGKAINSPYNPVKRTFTLKDDEIPLQSRQ